MPFKSNADRRRHIPKQRHRVTNWAEYDAGLRARGSLTVVRPDRMADDFAREAVAAIQIGHPVHPPRLTQPPRSGQRRFP